MPILVLQKVDLESVSPVFNVGEHVIGRGPLLLCQSKKVSRNHGLLRVTENEGIFLRSTHNNPCFHQTNQSPKIAIVTFGNTIQINNNDKIALSLDHGWFEVKIKSDVDSSNDDNNQNGSVQENESTIRTANKRGHEEDLKETAAKKAKPDEESTLKGDEINVEIPNQDSVQIEENNVPANSNVEIKTEPIEEDMDSEVRVKEEPLSQESDEIVIKQEPIDEPTMQNNFDVDIKTEIKTEPNENEDACDSKKSNDEPSTSGTNGRVWKDRCWYGSSCYRKNAAHRVEFTHPGDPDYDSDANDSRPICCYGKECYRKNREHRSRYRHPGQDKLGPRPSPNKRRQVKVQQVTAPVDSDLDDSYDYSDPFINDGSSDEFEPSQISETESEYEDSQNVEEDTKQMLHEARKFTRKKK